jgi:hypothetical protein
MYFAGTYPYQGTEEVFNKGIYGSSGSTYVTVMADHYFDAIAYVKDHYEGYDKCHYSYVMRLNNGILRRCYSFKVKINHLFLAQ